LAKEAIDAATDPATDLLTMRFKEVEGNCESSAVR
jgi:hypothetical protein